MTDTRILSRRGLFGLLAGVIASRAVPPAPAQPEVVTITIHALEPAAFERHLRSTPALLEMLKRTDRTIPPG